MFTKWSPHLAPNLKQESNMTISLRTLNTEVLSVRKKKIQYYLHAWSDFIMQFSGNKWSIHSRRVCNNKEIKSKHMKSKLQSWTKVLGQIYICGALSHASNKFIYTCSASPPPSLLQCWTRVHAISPECQHCIGGWGEEATQSKTDNSAFLKFRFKNTGN